MARALDGLQMTELAAQSATLVDPSPADTLAAQLSLLRTSFEDWDDITATADASLLRVAMPLAEATLIEVLVSCAMPAARRS